MSEDKDKWCWTRIGEARQRNKDNFGKCMSEILQILLEACKLSFSISLFESFITFIYFKFWFSYSLYSRI